MTQQTNGSSSTKVLVGAFVVAVVLPCICCFCLLALSALGMSLLPIEEILSSPNYYWY